MVDETLIAAQLRERSDDGLIENFNDACLNGASYDFRAGKTVVVARPDESKYLHLSLKDAGTISLNPGAAYTFYSQEKVNLPNDIKGSLSLRSYFANKKLFFPGGLIDPGYKGYLFFTIFNMGNSTIEIEYSEKLVKGEFVRIKRTETYAEEEVLELAEDKLPPLPSQPQKMHDWAEMNVLLTDHGDRMDEMRDKLNELNADLGQTNKLIEYLLLTAVGGIIAGATIQILSGVL